jgi:hypothetical protein
MNLIKKKQQNPLIQKKCNHHIYKDSSRIKIEVKLIMKKLRLKIEKTGIIKQNLQKDAKYKQHW